MIHGDPRRAWAACQAMILQAEQKGGVDAVIEDVKANYGITLTVPQVRNIMTCGGLVIMMGIGQAMAAGVLKVDHGRLEELLDKASGEPDSAAPKSSDSSAEDTTITLDAERAAADAIARIRKLH